MTVFLALTIASFIVLVAGTAWMLAAAGRTTRRSGPEVGAEIMGASDEGGEGIGGTLLDKSVFKGTGVSVSREASFSYAEIKRLVRGRNWRAALPPLLAMGGLFCFIVFGVIALWLALDDKLIASLIAIPVLFTMGRIAWQILRA